MPWLNSTAVDIISADNVTGKYANDAAACVGAGTAAHSSATANIGEIYTGTVSYTVTSTNLTDTTTCLPSTFVLQMLEEDKNGNIAHADGDKINVTLGWDSSATAEVEVSSMATENPDATSTEILDTDVWRDFTYSALATEILYNKPSSGQKSVKIIYHGDEVSADVYITSPEAVVSTTPGGALGDVLVKDTEVSSVSSKNCGQTQQALAQDNS
jgi:hypothetical protein